MENHELILMCMYVHVCTCMYVCLYLCSMYCILLVHVTFGPGGFGGTLAASAARAWSEYFGNDSRTSSGTTAVGATGDTSDADVASGGTLIDFLSLHASGPGKALVQARILD